MNRRYTHMLCFILAFILTVSVTPISAAEGDAPSEETQPSDTVSVVVATRDIPIGTRLSGEHITVVEMKNKNIPANTVSDPTLLIGKNAHEDIYEGEYVRALQLTDLTVYPINKELLLNDKLKDNSNYICVTDHLIPNTGEDLSGILQRLI